MSPPPKARAQIAGLSSGKPAAVRCAIYTRKSTDEGLDREFNTLDAQREAAEAYIASQRHEDLNAAGRNNRRLVVVLG